jgi:hypothetical protein
LGTDTFQRANQLHWGTASDGQSWSGDANSASGFSISSNAGLVNGSNGNKSYSAVLGPPAANAEVFAASSASAFGHGTFGDALRWTDASNGYKAYVDGSKLIIQKTVGGIATTLASRSFAAAARTSYTIHFRAVGTTLTANVWPTSGAEPSGWMLTATDGTLAWGRTGMQIVTQKSSVTVTSFRAVAL